MNKEDIQSYCDDLTAWIMELGLAGELEKAHPKSVLPLQADLEDLDDSLDILFYLTLWMCLKSNKTAPPHIESRMMLCGNTRGPWKKLYSKLCIALEEKEVLNLNSEDFWGLAG